MFFSGGRCARVWSAAGVWGGGYWCECAEVGLGGWSRGGGGFLREMERGGVCRAAAGIGVSVQRWGLGGWSRGGGGRMGKVGVFLGEMERSGQVRG